MMSRTRLFALAVAALAGATLSACDPVAQVQSAAVRGGGSDVKLSEDAEKNECVTCAKFRARPPSGINVPPSL
jgi:hypothetical protein